MEEVWPGLIDALVEETPRRRARLLWTTLAWVNIPSIAGSAFVALDPDGQEQSYRLVVFLACAAYTLVPSLLFMLAYGLWLAMGRRRRVAPRSPLQLNG
ncbi:hypothetical protein SGCZBJ_15095 [Caulobacter zeae]|uniref:Uncharacterized protein n=1 Tax=Caulobacter zeae TaxID=2055137 RepID=A0A2N5DCX9_9CAUL|nr:hypothetical protein [Caulobacter zeae]PLR23902.1 hypothetical protein SGCZBJ_15095 [Caulobacter zeae]